MSILGQKPTPEQIACRDGDAEPAGTRAAGRGAVTNRHTPSHANATREGLRRARARGVRLGRPPTTDPQWLARMAQAIQAVRAGASYRAAARQFRISRKAILARIQETP